MSTEVGRRFARRFAAVIGALALVATAGAIASSLQGPRITDVQSDATGATEAAGSRVIITTNQVLGEAAAEAVSVTPAAAHTVDVSGRSIGVRFTQPLDYDTTYTIAIAGARASGGGPAADLSTSLTTAAAELFVLQRDAAGLDRIVRTGLTGGEPSVIFEHPHIEEYRQAGDELVVSVLEDERAALLVMDRDGSDVRRLELPGVGSISHVQISDRGGLVGYLYSDADLSAAGGRASVLFTMPLAGGTPTPVLVSGEAASVDAWQFVPDATAILFIDWNSELLLADPIEGGEPTRFGFARTIDGISRGTYTAIVRRAELPVRIDLRTAAESEVTPPVRSGTVEEAVTPLADEALLWPFTVRDAEGIPTDVALVVADGEEVRELLVQPIADPVLDVCASPSGSLLALTVAPDFVNNPYGTGYLLPVPGVLQTRIVRASDGEEVTRLDGFGINWCTSGPPW